MVFLYDIYFNAFTNIDYEVKMIYYSKIKLCEIVIIYDLCASVDFPSFDHCIRFVMQYFMWGWSLGLYTWPTAYCITRIYYATVNRSFLSLQYTFLVSKSSNTIYNIYIVSKIDKFMEIIRIHCGRLNAYIVIESMSCVLIQATQYVQQYSSSNWK